MSLSTTPLRRFAGLIFVTMAIALLEITGRPPGLDPAVLVPMAVLAGAAIDGLVGGSIGAAVGGAYIFLYHGDPALAGAASQARTLLGLAGTAIGLLVAVVLLDHAGAAQRSSARRAADSLALGDFGARLAVAAPDDIADAAVDAAAELVDADMAVLTVLDVDTGRHVVRAARGDSSAIIGIEVPAGAGLAGKAIRQRRLVVAGEPSSGSARCPSLTLAAVPALRGGRVIASLSVGRADGTPFTPDDLRLLAAAGPLIGIAVGGSAAA